MHLRKLTLTVGLFGTLFSTWAFSLGLGEITLKSKLNQPLDAEIKLLQVRNLDAEDILVELAPAADFQRFGIERLFFLQNLKFDVQLDHPNGPVVRIRSDEPVREPYLVFLVQAQSPSSGRLLREYTLLLDLPVFASETPAPVQAPALRSEPELPNEPAMRAPAAPAPSSPRIAQREGEPYRAPRAPGRSTSAASSPATFDGDVYGPVQANDTLWEIASRVRPGGVSVQQSMLALQRANPDAFINGNINLLKRGQVLRIPEDSEWHALDQQSAIREVASQNRQWNSRSFDNASGAELAASSSRPTRERGSDGPRGQLTLSAPGGLDGAGETSGAGNTAGRSEALQNELAIVSEQLDATQRENRELNSRILELEEQISTMERLLDVSSAELRALQLAAEQEQGTEASEQADAEALEDAEAASDIAGEADVEAEETVAEEAVAEDAVTEEAAIAPAQPTTKVVTRQAPPPPSLMDKLMGNIWYLLGGALALIAGLGYALYRRRQQEDEWEAFDDDDLFTADSDLPGAGDQFMEEGGALDDEGFSGFEEDGPDSDFDEDQPVEAETGDVVAEADIYIAYGKLDQAEEMLRRALADDAGHVDARIKLLEVLVEKNDVEAFDDEYRVLLSSGDSGARSRAAELRSGFVDAPAFVEDMGGAEQSVAEESTAADSNLPDLDDADPDFGDLDLSFDLDATEDSDDFENAGSSEQSAALDFNLDLSEDFAQEDSSGEESDFGESAFDFELDEAPAAQASEASDELGGFELDLAGEALDLDLDLDGSEQPAEAPTIDSGLSFDLELDEGLELDLPTAGDQVEDAAQDNALSLDLDDVVGTLDDALTLESEDEAEAEVAATDLSFDLDTAELNLEPAAADELSLDAEPAFDSADDDFDVELGDLDLEALDQEMDALVGSVDDDDVDMAAPLTLQEEQEEETPVEAAPAQELKPNGLDIEIPAPESTAFSEDQDFDPDDLEDEFDFLSESDEVATKLDLARAYIDMGDQDGAKDILDEVTAEGNEEQKREAQALLEKMV